MILKAKHHPVIYTFFKWYAVWIIRRHFKKVSLHGDFQPNGKAILLISNHMSWWDGFWSMYLNVKVFKRKFHFMMLEKQLKKFWFFQYSGGYSVNKNAKSLVESLTYTSEILSGNQNLVLVFPQGKIQSLYTNEFLFERGIEHIIKLNANKIQIIFQVNLIDYLSERRPELSVYYGTYEPVNYVQNHLQDAYNGFYTQCISDYMDNIECQ